MDRAESLARAVEGILASYTQQGNINHHEETALPSKSRVAQLLDQLMDLVFPGYFGEDNLDELTSGYVVGERCARLLRDLSAACTRAFRAERAEAGDADAYASRAALSLLEAMPRVRDVLATDVQAALLGDPAAASAE